MREFSARNLILVGLLALTAGYFFYQNMGFSLIPALQARPTPSKGLQELHEIPSVQFAHLQNVSRLKGEASRNLFRFGQKPVPVQPPPPKPVPPPKPKIALPLVQAPSPSTQEEAKGPGPVPKVDFTFLGYFGPQAAPYLVFVKDTELVIVKKGDLFLEEYRVLDIGYESVEIGFKNHPGRKRLPLGG